MRRGFYKDDHYEGVQPKRGLVVSHVSYSVQGDDRTVSCSLSFLKSQQSKYLSGDIRRAERSLALFFGLKSRVRFLFSLFWILAIQV